MANKPTSANNRTPKKAKRKTAKKPDPIAPEEQILPLTAEEKAWIVSSDFFKYLPGFNTLIKEKPLAQSKKLKIEPVMSRPRFEPDSNLITLVRMTGSVSFAEAYPPFLEEYGLLTEKNLASYTHNQAIGFVQITPKDGDGLILISKELKEIHVYAKNNKQRAKLKSIAQSLANVAGWDEKGVKPHTMQGSPKEIRVKLADASAAKYQKAVDVAQKTKAVFIAEELPTAELRCFYEEQYLRMKKQAIKMKIDTQNADAPLSEKTNMALELAQAMGRAKSKFVTGIKLQPENFDTLLDKISPAPNAAQPQNQTPQDQATPPQQPVRSQTLRSKLLSSVKNFASVNVKRARAVKGYASDAWRGTVKGLTSVDNIKLAGIGAGVGAGVSMASKFAFAAMATTSPLGFTAIGVLALSGAIAGGAAAFATSFYTHRTDQNRLKIALKSAVQGAAGGGFAGLIGGISTALGGGLLGSVLTAATVGGTKAAVTARAQGLKDGDLLVAVAKAAAIAGIAGLIGGMAAEKLSGLLHGIKASTPIATSDALQDLSGSQAAHVDAQQPVTAKIEQAALFEQGKTHGSDELVSVQTKQPTLAHRGTNHYHNLNIQQAGASDSIETFWKDHINGKSEPLEAFEIPEDKVFNTIDLTHEQDMAATPLTPQIVPDQVQIASVDLTVMDGLKDAQPISVADQPRITTVDLTQLKETAPIAVTGPIKVATVDLTAFQQSEPITIPDMPKVDTVDLTQPQGKTVIVPDDKGVMTVDVTETQKAPTTVSTVDLTTDQPADAAPPPEAPEPAKPKSTPTIFPTGLKFNYV